MHQQCMYISRSAERNKIIIRRDVNFHEDIFWCKNRIIKINGHNPDLNKKPY